MRISDWSSDVCSSDLPAGPMPSGLANKEKQRVRQLYAEGKATRDELLEAEAASYHGAGTCTFYGTANSNQMMMELMGLTAPAAASPNPGTSLRKDRTPARRPPLAPTGGAAAHQRRLGRRSDERATEHATPRLQPPPAQHG